MLQFFISLRNTLAAIFTDAGVVLILIIAPIVYGFYYPLPYSSEIVRHLPVAIVDHSQDSLSRTLIRRVAAAPAVDIHVLSDEYQAKQEMLENRIVAFMVIPADLKRHVTLQKSFTVNMIGNAAYVLASKYAQQAMAEATLSVSKDIEIERLKPFGLGEAKIRAIQDPVPLRIQTLNNATEGYGSYVVPAVAWLILQQTLLISCAMLVSTWWEKGRAYAPPSAWLGRLTAISVIHYVVCAAYTGMIFDFWGYKTLANPMGNLWLIALFSPCVATLGCVLGLLIKDRERTMQVLVFAALPMYFVSGYSWPTPLLPEFLQYVRWALPSTSVIQAGISFNQLGGTMMDNRQYFMVLGGITWVGLSALFLLGRER